MSKSDNRMTKGDLITIIANKADIPKATVEKVLETFCATVITELSKGHTVTLTGFGKFENANYKPREVKSPLTGKTTTLEERVIPTFKPAKAVKEKVNRKISIMRQEKVI